MALIKCIECGNMISEYAEKCPHCACPIDRIKEAHTTKVENLIPDEERCWFCEKRQATTTYKHTFVEVQYYNTTMMRKKRELSKEVEVPCCSKCKNAIESKKSYGIEFALIGTAIVLIPFDYWMYTIEPGLLIAAIVFEIVFVAALIATLFYYLGEYVWKITHKQLNNMLKRDISEHKAKRELELYARTHPLTKPTLSEYLGIK